MEIDEETRDTGHETEWDCDQLCDHKRHCCVTTRDNV